MCVLRGRAGNFSSGARATSLRTEPVWTEVWEVKQAFGAAGEGSPGGGGAASWLPEPRRAREARQVGAAQARARGSAEGLLLAMGRRLSPVPGRVCLTFSQRRAVAV